MTRQPSSRREEAATQKDLKKLQQREQRILTKLAEAREAQASALKRLAEAQARVLLVEGRLQAVRARLQTSQSSPDHSQEASPSSVSLSDEPTIGAQLTPSAHTPAIPTGDKAHVAQAEGTRPTEKQRKVEHTPEHLSMLEPVRQRTEQPTDEAELLALVAEMSAGIPRETLPQTGELPTPDILAEDLEDTARRAALQPTPSATPIPQENRRDQQEEDALIAAILAMTHTEPRAVGEMQNSTRQAVQRAEQALNEINLAILNGTLSGFEAETALREAEASVSQARARFAETAPSPTQKTVARESGTPDSTDKLPVMHDRDARTQEPM